MILLLFGADILFYLLNGITLGISPLNNIKLPLSSVEVSGTYDPAVDITLRIMQVIFKPCAKILAQRTYNRVYFLIGPLV